MFLVAQETSKIMGIEVWGGLGNRMNQKDPEIIINIVLSDSPTKDKTKYIFRGISVLNIYPESFLGNIMAG